jgi:hypothetical protein
LFGPVGRMDRDTLVAGGVAVLLVVAMAIDHLVGTDRDEGEESGIADPGAFVFSVLLSGVLMAVLFLFVVRRTGPDDAAKRGVLWSALSVPAIVLAFLGLPYPLAAAGIALGLRGRSGPRRRLADAALVVGSLVVGALTIGYVFALIV